MLTMEITVFNKCLFHRVVNLDWSCGLGGWHIGGYSKDICFCVCVCVHVFLEYIRYRVSAFYVCTIIWINVKLKIFVWESKQQLYSTLGKWNFLIHSRNRCHITDNFKYKWHIGFVFCHIGLLIYSPVGWFIPFVVSDTVCDCILVTFYVDH